jgi:hypothetical protein
MRIKTGGLAVPGLLFLTALLFSGCKFINFPLDEFHAEQTGKVSLAAFPASASTALGTDGVICVAPGTREISIPIDNPEGLSLREAGLVSGAPGVTARQSPDKNAVILTFPVAATAGDTYQLTLNLTTEKEGRVLPPTQPNLSLP